MSGIVASLLCVSLAIQIWWLNVEVGRLKRQLRRHLDWDVQWREWSQKQLAAHYKHLRGLGVQLKRLRERLSEPKKPSSAKSEGPKTSIESSPSPGASALAPNDSKNSPQI